MRKLRYLSISLVLTGLSSVSHAWQREINAQYSTSGVSTYREIRIQNRGAEYSQARLQVFGSPAVVARIEIVGEDGMSLPAMELDGLYEFRQARYLEFPKAKIRSIRAYVTSEGSSNLIYHFR